jgi:hypothetical protein
MASLLGGAIGPVPTFTGGQLIGRLEAANLLGRGGAGFPVGRKWRAVADRGQGRAVVLANGAEGEPLSAKDRTLMAARPHLVIDARCSPPMRSARRTSSFMWGRRIAPPRQLSGRRSESVRTS